jgi:hypothetical protein
MLELERGSTSSQSVEISRQTLLRTTTLTGLSLQWGTFYLCSKQYLQGFYALYEYLNKTLPQDGKVAYYGEVS